MFKLISLCSALLLFSFALIPLANAQSVSSNENDTTHWVQFIFENDAISAINKSDDGYSNGIALFWGGIRLQ